MLFVPARRLVASLLVAASALLAGTSGALAGPTGPQRTNHYKFLGAWWGKADTAQAEATRFMVGGKNNRECSMCLTVTRPSLGMNDVVLGPLTIGTKYASDAFMLRIPNSTWGRVVFLQLENRGGKYWLEARDRVSRQVVSLAGLGGSFPATFAYELVKKR